MRKLCFVMFIMAVIMMSCGKKKPSWPVWIKGEGRCLNTSDSTFTIIAFDDTFIVHPGDTFPDEHPWNFPDSIKVAFTRDGKFEDSIWAYVEAVPKDSDDAVYVYRVVVGDAWYYNLKGKFCYFVECPCPHSGQGHTYHP